MAAHDEAAGDGLTAPGDWDEYHARLETGELWQAAKAPTFFDSFLEGKTGRVFELGCGGSPFLVRAALAGWQVGGIDFVPESISPIDDFLEARGLPPGEFIRGDIAHSPPVSLEGRYDLLVSAGFLEHFTDPASVLRRWKRILKPDGKVVTVIPNLMSVNAAVFRHYDYEFFSQHIVTQPDDMDQYHVEAGLKVQMPAHYVGRYDYHMLIPWSRIAEGCVSFHLFRLLKVAGVFAFALPLKHLMRRPSRRWSPCILGSYTMGKDRD